MSEIDNMIRTRQVQDEALAEITAKIQSCQESMQNFDHLSKRIGTLPDKLSHEVMVPFGKLAFMPGRLVHTNELLVHLGDAYFASMSCKQALKVVEMRRKNLQASLKDLEKVGNNIQMKGQYLNEIRDAAQGREFEIKEELREDYSHPKDRRRVGRLKDEEMNETKGMSKKKSLVPPKNIQADEHAALMAKLDELQRMEEEEDESCRSSDSGEAIDTDSKENADLDDDKQPVRRHVRFEEPIEANPPEGIPAPCTIRFKHSKTDVKKSDEMTPGDVHKLVHAQIKSILKSKHYEHDSSTTNEIKGTVQCKDTVVSDLVVERTSVNFEDSQEPTSSKPVSKFKAARMKR